MALLLLALLALIACFAGLVLLCCLPDLMGALFWIFVAVMALRFVGCL